MANENLSDETMIEVLKKVKLWDIFSKNKGLDTNLESQGKNLSGGQAQRVALARALLYDASVYIFDEATSNIDIESEEIILNIIYSYPKKKLLSILVIDCQLSKMLIVSMLWIREKLLKVENMMNYIPKKSFITICINIKKNWKLI